MIDAEEIVQFIRRCTIQFATTATGPQVPWAILCVVFRGPWDVSWVQLCWSQCHYMSLFTRDLKVSGLEAILPLTAPVLNLLVEGKLLDS